MISRVLVGWEGLGLWIRLPLLGGSMKSLMSLYTALANDCANACCTSATPDINTVRRRFKHEGLSFLMITLPDFGKATQKWLDQGQVGPQSAFKTDGGLPLFLGGFLARVFDRRSGALLDAPDVNAISAILQLTLGFAKIAYPCSDARVRKAMSDYVKCEQEVRQADSRLTERDLREFEEMSALLFRSVFSKMDRDVHYGDLLPKHGPGSTADGLTGNGKYRLMTWTSRLERVFKLDEYLFPNHHFLDGLEQVSLLEPGSEMPVKVIPVPKTLKTPRIIAMEPTCVMYTQQALLRSFLEAWEKDDILHQLIGFDDQVPNQELARQGSVDGQTATLDLSEASDRVSNQLVRTMLRRWPLLREAFDATRSRRAEVDGHGVIRLAKYASMGSALCFPVEAMVFLTLIFLGIQRSLNVTLTKKDISSFLGSVRVYGDDLIVPTRHVLSIVEVLQHFGAVVGLGKSFWTGMFRESCGKEYFNGIDVSTVKVRQVLPSTIADATGVISTVSLRNQLYERGYYGTAGWLDNRLTKMLKHFPIVGPDSPVLGRISVCERETVDKWDPNLYTPLVRGYVVEAKPPKDPLDGQGALLKCFLKLETAGKGDLRDEVVKDPLAVLRTASLRDEASLVAPQPSQAEDHLERSGRPKRVSIKLGWSSVR